MQQLEKVSALPYEQFVERYLKPGIPVILTDASASWKSNTQFTPAFFQEHFADYSTTHDGTTYSMRDILEITARSTPENPAPYPMLFEVPTQLPKLLEMLEPVHMHYSLPNWFGNKLMPYGRFGNSIHLFIGGRGNQYNLHQDMYHTNAWITQLYGEKEFVLFPREQAELLYPIGLGFISPINILKPDYEKYPKYRAATPLRVVLKPGETIFIPNGIWHTTVAVGHNISLIFDQLNRYNYQAWKKDMYDYPASKSKLRGIVVSGIATALGTLCRLMEKSTSKSK
ncbi:cupin-like domain-containing protein [Hymenobacter psoromatis]|uniref:cupin-like domain-containing protein n=1 Tax=Hymenobacter psoromatis TaxID=1484116 RepID=UPI001CBE8A05|nr:cupin-like domain-containing protein [Hymenobacter psoromatis]